MTLVGTAVVLMEVRLCRDSFTDVYICVVFRGNGVVVLNCVLFHHAVVELNKVLFWVDVLNCLVFGGTLVVLNCVEFSGRIVV